MPEETGENPAVAPDGFLWVCMACGKTARDRYNGTGGWDESCFLNCALLPESRLTIQDGRVIAMSEA